MRKMHCFNWNLTGKEKGEGRERESIMSVEI